MPHKHRFSKQRPRVAIIHDWCVIYGGAERVLEHIIDCYPQADVFSLIDRVPGRSAGFPAGQDATDELPAEGTLRSQVLPQTAVPDAVRDRTVRPERL